MPITELLERNAREYANDICLVEINPEVKEVRRVTWKEYLKNRCFGSAIELPLRSGRD